MSYLSQKKRDWGYETNVPRCEICVHFSVSKIVLTTDSLTKRINHHCNSGGFTCAPNSCCDKWTGKDGTIADPAPLVLVRQVKVTETVYDCVWCGKTFAKRSSRDAHMRDSHQSPAFSFAGLGKAMKAPT